MNETESATPSQRSVDNSDNGAESDDEEDPSTTYARRIIMRNRMYKDVEQIETAQRRIEHGDDDDVAIHKAVKHYAQADILKEEYRPIVNGRDLSIDSVLGDRLSRVLLIKAGKISSGSDKFKFNDFAENVMERGSFREFYRQDLNGILDTCVNFKSLAIVDFGAPPKPKKVRAERAPRKNTVKGELVDVKGKKTDEIDDEKDADFTRQLDHVIKSFRSTLKESKLNRVNYYEFVIDPNDFGTTVQNCFCVSFLLKDMRLYLEKKEEDEFPYLRRLTKDEKAAADQVLEGGKPLPTNQTINTFTYAKWQGLIRDLKITEALIKPNA
uniref:Non-structural maintenance of chromosomes element 4 n=1 Tax=Panagrolaimus superbus TaxID=310955 RepID=A0A914Z979_9BILA